MVVEVEVSTREQQCFAGDVVEGTVILNVSTKYVEGSSADKLVLKLVGLARTRVMYGSVHPVLDGATAQTYTDRQVMAEDNEFLSYDVQLASFGGKATSGTHSFPFSVVLPPSLPPSMEEEGGSGSSCAIAYGFEARLHRPGVLDFDAKGKSQLRVVVRPPEDIAAPVMVGPATEVVKKLCCLNSGSMSIGFRADRSAVARGGSLGLTAVARNDSSSSVKAMHVELVQVSTWFAYGCKESKTRTIASVVVTGAELGSALAAAKKGNQRGRGPVAVADAARRDLQEVLDAGAGTRYELAVPDKCLDTMKTTMIQVGHSLSVRLKTPSCINSPDVWMPLRVQPPLGAGGGKPAMTAVPYSTAMEMKMDVGGEAKPVSVPQSEVKLEYRSSEMPQPSAPTKYRV